MPNPAPTDAATIHARALALLAEGASAAALDLLEPARTRFAGHAGIAGRYADALHLAGRLGEAIRAYQAAIALDPTAAEAWYGLGCAWLARQGYGSAAQALERAAALQPDAGGPAYNLGKALFELGRVDAAMAWFGKAAGCAAAEPAELARNTMACIVPGSDAADNATVLRVRQDWAARAAEKHRAPPRPASTPARRLRIGYLSAFFGARNWMKPVWGLINHHDRNEIEVHMFSDGADPSAESGYRDEPTDYVHAIRGIPDERVAKIIRDVGIDVLVDLNGYSFQPRLNLLMLRPAPVIVAWFNMFATSGVAGVDWLVGDHAVIPPDEERHYVERIHRLPGSYLAFETLYPVPDIAPPPCCRPGRGIAFGCLGSQYKLTDAVLAAWGRILGAAPATSLLIRNATLDDASTRADLLARLGAQGVDKARVTLAGRAEHFDFLATYDRIDIALDTFPYNGGTTTTEALWQGVPTLAFDGDRWAARTSKSLLLAAGLQDWVMPDLAAYEQRAVALAVDPATPQHLADLRSQMRVRLRAAPVCDTAGLCRAMEAFYRQITGRGGVT